MQNWTVDWNPVNAIAALVTSIFVALGFLQWREQIIEKRKIELAEEATDLFSALPDIFRYVRARILTVEDMENRPLASYQERWKRFHSYNDHFFKIVGLKYRFICRFEQGKKPFQTFEKLHKKFIDDLSLLIELAQRNELAKSPEDVEEMSKTILFQGDNDLFQQELEQARDEILAIFLSTRPVSWIGFVFRIRHCLQSRLLGLEWPVALVLWAAIAAACNN